MSRTGKLLLTAFVLGIAAVAAARDGRVADTLSSGLVRVLVAVSSETYRENLVSSKTNFNELYAAHAQLGKDHDTLHDVFVAYKQDAKAKIAKLEQSVDDEKAMLTTVMALADQVELDFRNKRRQMRIYLSSLKRRYIDLRTRYGEVSLVAESQAAQLSALSKSVAQLREEASVRSTQVAAHRIALLIARNERKTQVDSWEARLKESESHSDVFQKIVDTQHAELVALRARHAQLQSERTACTKRSVARKRPPPKQRVVRIIQKRAARVQEPCFLEVIFGK